MTFVMQLVCPSISDVQLSLVSFAPLLLVRTWVLSSEAPSQRLASVVYTITDQQMIPPGYP
jgi:hypothetical protein